MWTDKRPISILSLGDASFITPANPNGWRNGGEFKIVNGSIDPTTFLVWFKQACASAVNAGCGTLFIQNLEGYFYPSYVGDPFLQHDPAMASILNEMFMLIFMAGLTPMLTMRHTSVQPTLAGDYFHTEPIPGGVDLLIKKIQKSWARWKVSRFYVDTNLSNVWQVSPDGGGGLACVFPSGLVSQVANCISPQPDIVWEFFSASMVLNGAAWVDLGGQPTSLLEQKIAVAHTVVINDGRIAAAADPVGARAAADAAYAAGTAIKAFNT